MSKNITENMTEKVSATIGLKINLKINGQAIQVTKGCTVAAAIVMGHQQTFRTSVSGEGRAPLCGMGICFECRVTIDGQAHCRSCQILCQEGMDVTTHE